jgi:hypothetical protein
MRKMMMTKMMTMRKKSQSHLDQNPLLARRRRTRK